MDLGHVAFGFARGYPGLADPAGGRIAPGAFVDWLRSGVGYRAAGQPGSGYRVAFSFRLGAASGRFFAAPDLDRSTLVRGHDPSLLPALDAAQLSAVSSADSDPFESSVRTLDRQQRHLRPAFDTRDSTDHAI